MPTPNTLTTGSHSDFDLEVIAGAWRTDIAGEVLFSAPMRSGDGNPDAPHVGFADELTETRLAPLDEEQRSVAYAVAEELGTQ